jgi:methionyl aminopeptidase
VSISSAEELAGMRQVGALVRDLLAHLQRRLEPGMTTGDLDADAARFLAARGAASAPQTLYAFPGATCLSVNDEIVHGVPSRRVVTATDLVKIDVTAQLDGFIADAAVSVPMPGASEEARHLAACAREAFTLAMTVVRAGALVSRIGGIVDRTVRARGFRVVRELTGHGVGRAIHEPPDVPNIPMARRTDRLTRGLVIAVEPIIAARQAHVVTAADGWTLRTHNGALAAHYEHTVIVTDGEPEILTAA